MQKTIVNNGRSYVIQEIKRPDGSKVYGVIGPQSRKVKVLTYKALLKLYPSIKSEIRKYFG